MGVNLQTITQDNAPLFGLKEPHGAIASDVTAGGPAAKAGVKSGDVITAIDGKKVEGYDDLTMDVISRTPGSTVNLDILRNGQAMKISVTLGTRPGGVDWEKSHGQGDSDKDDNNDNNSSGNVSSRGMTVETLTPELAQQVGVTPGTKGVVIDEVDQSSSAAEAVGRGMVITSVNRQPVSSAQDFKRLMSQASGKAVLLGINQNGANLFLVVQP